MAITIKSPEQIEKMRVAGDILRRLDLVLRAEIKAGITTKELDTIAEDFIRSCVRFLPLNDTEDFPVQYVYR